MSESDEHRCLVISMANTLMVNNPNLVILTDLQKHPGDTTTPKIGNYKPDIYAYAKNRSFHVVAEAKTGDDLDTIHSRAQVGTFLSHLESLNAGRFILGVSGNAADGAKTMLKFTSYTMGLQKVELKVFDGLDYWRLDYKGGTGWHLN